MTEDGRTNGGKWKIGQCSVGPETAKNLDRVNGGNTDLEPSRRIVLANLTLVDVAVNVGVAFYWSPTLLVLVTYFVFFAS